MNFSQEARIQHVSKHFPCYPEKISNLPKQLPNLFNLALLKKKKKKKKKIQARTKSNIWSILEIIDCAGYTIPYMEIQKIKKKITELLEKAETHKKFEEVNYWGKINTRGLDYNVIIGIPKNIKRGIEGLEFWVSQKMEKWVPLKPVNCKMMQHSK